LCRRSIRITTAFSSRRQDFPAFYARAGVPQGDALPPLVALINAVVRAARFAGAMDDAAGIAQRLRQDAERAGLRVLGPAPAPLGKLRGEYRAQLLLKGSRRKTMRDALLKALAARPDIARRTSVDVDPVSVL
jgi:primosomal protein N' (replication factor Y)